LLFVAAAAMMLASCEKQPQSELNFVDMKTATIQVFVEYNPGEHQVNGVLINGNLPYSEAEVVAKINYSEYSDEAEGVKQIEAENLGNGKYEVKVPVGQRPIDLEICVRGFNAKYYEASDFTVDAFFEANPEPVNNVVKDDLRSVSITMQKSSSVTNNSMTKKLKVLGTTKAQVEKIVYYDSNLTPATGLNDENNINRLEVAYIAKGCDYELELSNTTDNSRKITYTFKSDKTTGAFDETVKYYDSWNINDITVTIRPVAFIDACPHRYLKYNVTDEVYRADTQSINGYYSSNGKSKQANSGDLLIGVRMGDVNLLFTEENTADIRGLGSNTGADINGHNEYRLIYGGLWWN